jgi:hypothetical protein
MVGRTYAVKNIDAPMLTRVWQELEYFLAVCHVARGAHVEHLWLSKIFFGFPVASFDFLVINVCNHGEHYETPRI